MNRVFVQGSCQTELGDRPSSCWTTRSQWLDCLSLSSSF